MKRLLVALALICACIPLSASAGKPVTASDVVGNWRSKSDSKRVITIARNGNQLTVTTPEHNDWKPFDIPADGNVMRLKFTRNPTEEDLRKLHLDNKKDPPPEEVVTAAAKDSTLTEALTLDVARSWSWSGCDVSMNGQWQGFHLTWIENDPFTYQRDGQPTRKEAFEQKRYAWPDLRKTVVEAHYQDDVVRAELYSYFTEHAAMQVYGEFGKAMFTAIMVGVNFATPAEGMLDKLGRDIFSKVVEKGLEGTTPELKDMMEIVAGQALDKTLDAVADKSPFADIRAKVDESVGEDMADAIGDKAKGAVASGAADKLTSDQITQLQKYLKDQCRYETVRLEGYGATLGGVAVVDKQTGTATIWLIVQPRNGTPVTVIGTATVPEEGMHGSMTINFSKLN